MKKVAIGLLAVAICLSFSSSAFAQGKARLAITGFKNKAGVDKRVADSLVDMLSTAIVKANKFEVLERTQIGTVIEEQNFGASGAVDSATAAQIGQLKGAGYMVIGIVTEADYSSKNTKAFGIRVAKSAATLAVDLRFVDSSTGSTMWAETFREVRTSTEVASRVGGFNVRSGIGSEMARSLINNISRKVMSTVYPPKIIMATEVKVIMNYGEAMFTVGERWGLFSEGEALIDPDTGENLGSDEEQVGTMRVTRVSSKTSEGELIEGSASGGLICRLISGPVVSGESRKKVNPF